MTPTYTLHGLGLDFPVDVGRITAEQLVSARLSMGVTGEDLVAIGFDPHAAHPLPVVLAAMVISLQQQELPADPTWLARNLTLGTAVTVTVPNGEPAAEGAPTAGTTEQLELLIEMHGRGLLTDEEFAAKRAETLARI